MDYLINETLLFIPEENRLQRADDVSRNVVLPAPAALLFKVFSETPRQIISRNALMEEAWDRNGFSVSGNNLNTYLSVIRHSLMELGFERDLIKTLPRQGMILQATVQRLEGPVNAEPDSAPIVADAPPEPEATHAPMTDVSEPESPQAVKKTARFGYAITLGLGLVLAALLPWVLIPSSAPHFNQYQNILVGRMDQCSIHEFALQPPADTQRILQLIKDDPHFSRCKQSPGRIMVAERTTPVENILSLAICSQSGKLLHNCATYFTDKSQ